MDLKDSQGFLILLAFFFELDPDIKVRLSLS